MFYGVEEGNGRFVLNQNIMRKNNKAELKADLWDAFPLLAFIMTLILFFVALVIYFPF